LIEPALKEGFTVRAVTRDKNEDKAKELSGKGVEIVECNVVTATEAELKAVLKDSYAAFLVTDYWDEHAIGKEEEIGKRLVDAAKAAGVKHLLWSGLDNVKKVSKGKWEVPMFSQKAVISDYISELQSKHHRAFDYTTLVAPSFYFQNFQLSSVAKKEGNEWVFNLPETRWLTACDADEMGHAVVAALKDPARFDGKRITYWGEHTQPNIYVETFKRVTGEQAKLNLYPLEEFAKLPNPREFSQMLGWYDDFTAFGPIGYPFAEWSGQRNTPGGLSTWERYLEERWPWPALGF
jgi:uncharacterized protein YbjT (DUF2867 family)